MNEQLLKNAIGYKKKKNYKLYFFKCSDWLNDP